MNNVDDSLPLNVMGQLCQVVSKYEQGKKRRSRPVFEKGLQTLFLQVDYNFVCRLYFFFNLL